MPNNLPNWVLYLQAIGIPLIAAVVALTGVLVAFQQKKIAHAKLKHDLYDRRFASFDCVRKYLHTSIVNSGATNKESRDFIVGTADVIFLFDQSIVEYVERIKERGAVLTVINETLVHMSPGPPMTDQLAKKAETVAFLSDQLDLITDRFRPFLGLDQRGRH